MRWDGQECADIVKNSVYAVLFSSKIPQALTMGNKEYADFLKKPPRGFKHIISR